MKLVTGRAGAELESGTWCRVAASAVRLNEGLNDRTDAREWGFNTAPTAEDAFTGWNSLSEHAGRRRLCKQTSQEPEHVDHADHKGSNLKV